MAQKKSIAVEILSPKFRVSYPHLFQPSSFGNNPPKYSVTMLFDKTDPQYQKMIDAVNSVAAQAFPNGVPATLRNPLHDGDLEKEGDPNYAGKYYATASNTPDRKPKLVDENVNAIIDQSDFYAGCYAHAKLRFYVYNHGTPGVGISLGNIQKLADGEPLGASARKAEDDFAPVGTPQVGATFTPPVQPMQQPVQPVMPAQQPVMPQQPVQQMPQQPIQQYQQQAPLEQHQQQPMGVPTQTPGVLG